MDRTTMHRTPRKPHRNDDGYVCELRCRLGGHVVIYDRQRGADWIDADERWIVMHQPSTRHVAVPSLAFARDIMRGVARAESVRAAQVYADMLPEPEEAD